MGVPVICYECFLCNHPACPGKERCSKWNAKGEVVTPWNSFFEWHTEEVSKPLSTENKRTHKSL